MTITPGGLPLLEVATPFWQDTGSWALINFLVLAGLLVKYAGEPIKGLFAAKREAIAQAVSQADGALNAAQQALEAQKRSNAESGQALAEVAAGAKALAASLVSQIEADTTREVQRAQAAVEAEIVRERQAMLGKVRRELLRQALVEAERLIAESLSPVRHRQLFDAFALSAREIRP